MGPLFPLRREALWQLSLDPEEQRAALAGTVVTDELALDFDNAMESLPYACEVAGVRLDERVQASLARLSLDPPMDRAAVGEFRRGGDGAAWA